MMIPNYARYDRSISFSCNFLEEYELSQFPVNPYRIIELNKWGLITYSEMASHFSCTIDDTIVCLKSKDGFTSYDGSNFTIAYNDTKPKKRILFTLLHEIGHIYLGHLNDFEHTTLYRGSLTKSENKVLENEANTFARNVLSPSVFVKQMRDKSEKDLSRYFGISYDAARARLELLDSDYQRAENIGIQNRLNKLFYMFLNRYGCGNCKSIMFIRNPTHCPICSKKKLKWGEGQVFYRKYDTYENNNKVKICPNCNNEETNIDGDFCQICGKPLVNRCDDRGWDNYPTDDNRPCGKSVPSNARFCPYCGNKTTFFVDNVIKDWQSEIKEQDDTAAFGFMIANYEENQDEYEEEELPFN